MLVGEVADDLWTLCFSLVMIIFSVSPASFDRGQRNPRIILLSNYLLVQLFQSDIFLVVVNRNGYVVQHLWLSESSLTFEDSDLRSSMLSPTEHYFSWTSSSGFIRKGSFRISCTSSDVCCKGLLLLFIGQCVYCSVIRNNSGPSTSSGCACMITVFHTCLHTNRF